MRSITKKTQTGFTLLEITLAIAFISILLVTVALTTSNIIANYRKGLAMKAVNSTGLDLIDDFTSAIEESPTVDFTTFCNNYEANETKDAYNECIEDKGFKFIYQEYYRQVSINGADAKSVPVYGVFCTGKYSYIWNTGYAFNNEYYKLASGTNVPPATIIYNYHSDDNEDYQVNSNFRLLKILDTQRTVCFANLVDQTNELYNNYDLYSSKNYDTSTSTHVFDISKTTAGSESYLESEPIELIPASNSNLALFDFQVFRPIQDSASMRLFYSASMIVGTTVGSINIMTTSDYCQIPNGINSDFSYCAINKFNFAMRATGE